MKIAGFFLGRAQYGAQNLHKKDFYRFFASNNKKKNSKRLDQLRASLYRGGTGDGQHLIKRPRRPNLRKPAWIRIKPPEGEQLENYKRLKETVQGLGVATVCEEAKCPNIGECWGGSEHETATATIMLMGDTCTRACRFCAVKTSKAPPPLDPEEPEKVAFAVTKWGLDYVVLTSVNRDELEDQGANHFAATVKALVAKNEDRKKPLIIECLTPDFSGEEELVSLVANSGLHVFAHNIETVERLSSFVRDRRANYTQSLDVLEMAKKANPSLFTKSSIMLGFGESDLEVLKTLQDLRERNVDVVTFGQYLQPTKKHLKVKKYIELERFDFWKEKGEDMGFVYVASGPFVRSSYKAGEFFLENAIRRNMDLKEFLQTGSR